MSDRILRALMQLFALVAKVDEELDENNENAQSSKGIQILEAFLRSELASSEITKYINIFNERLEEVRTIKTKRDKDQKRASLNSVKALRICSQINEELAHRQKILVLIRMFEFVYSDDRMSWKEADFISTVADSFNVKVKEFELIKNFVEYNQEELLKQTNVFTYLPGDINIEEEMKAEIEVSPQLEGPLVFIYVNSISSIFLRYLGKDELFINGKVVDQNRVHLFSNGSTVRTIKTQQIYHSDLVRRLGKRKSIAPISYDLSNVLHKFKNGKHAIHKINIQSNGGNLIGIMGGSGAGKTSLLNIMSGRVKPEFGDVKINGISLFDEPEKLRGVIGNISQDDLLIEELTVFENLYYSAKLNLGDISPTRILQKTLRLLNELGLYEIRDLKVGSPLNKVISGGQRKRLNIAMELIREPAVLFIDEPTSGLSSRDSEYIMELLKEIALSGKLVFVVIHQPSSNIFKMFDRLLILDAGGYTVYDGIPVNAIVHFKKYSFKGNAHESECSLCGNVNPDQIFDLIESKVIDEYGLETGKRKNSPGDWNSLYLKHKEIFKFNIVDTPLKASFLLPSKLKQFFAYLTRDVKSKISNIQYLTINGLVAPILAVILSYFIKYFGEDGEKAYSLYQNVNIPQFIFISVIVAIFLGLTVSAEEINKDKRILLREKHLHLSRQSYLFSKVLIMFAISAFQTFLFVTISHSILEIKGMWLPYWIVLFSTSCMANIAGLVISSAFNSAKVIYILVPLMIIPQLLFSGVIVKFDKLHPDLSDATKVPVIGNAMVSRWAYEAIAVEQASQNDFEKDFLTVKINLSGAAWKKDYWLPEIRKNIMVIEDSNYSNTEKLRAKELLINELIKEESAHENLKCADCKDEISKAQSPVRLVNARSFLEQVDYNLIQEINLNQKKVETMIDSIGIENYRSKRDINSNQSLMDIVTNSQEMKKTITSDNKLYRNAEPIYFVPENNLGFFDTHFYAPYKFMFNRKYRTLEANLIVIWGLSLLAYLVLYFDLLRLGMDFSERFFSRFKKKI